MIRTATLSLLLATPAAAEPGIFGEWCGEGTAIGIEAAGLGNFEHTFCSFDTPQTDGPAIETEMTCRSTFHDENLEPVIMQEFRTPIAARLVTPDTLSLDYKDGRTPLTMERCDDF